MLRDDEDLALDPRPIPAIGRAASSRWNRTLARMIAQNPMIRKVGNFNTNQPTFPQSGTVRPAQAQGRLRTVSGNSRAMPRRAPTRRA